MEHSDSMHMLQILMKAYSINQTLDSIIDFCGVDLSRTSVHLNLRNHH